MTEHQTLKETLVKERSALVERKILLEGKIAAIDTDTQSRRDMVDEINWINRQISVTNRGLANLHRQMMGSAKPKGEKKRDFTWEILQEILSPEKMQEIKHENYRRTHGESPKKLQLFEVVENNDKANEYRLLASELINELIAAREKLNDVILTGCAKWDKAEFLKTMSPINMAIKPIGEYEKVKRLNYLK